MYGEGTVFPLKIARDAKVSTLQKAIFDDQRYHERFSFPPSALTLYLAKKDGVWLKNDHRVKIFLQAGKSARYEKMRPSWKLNKTEYLGNFQLGEEEIHILVELPEAAADQAQAIRPFGDELKQGARSLQDLNIRAEPSRSVPFATEDPTPVGPFTWENVRDECGQVVVLTEERQREKYREYVEDSIGNMLAKKQLCVLGLEKGKNLLSVAVPGHDVDLVGRTDMLVLSDLAKQFPTHLELLPEVKMLIEVKRIVEGGAVFQALSELIALDVLVNDPVMALLSDLTGHWQFFWVSERNDSHAIIRTVIITDPSTAFAVIRTLLAQSASADAEIRLPCFAEPVKRRKLVNVLPPISEGGESGGIRAAIERYYDIASVLGPDIEMARAVAIDLVPFSQTPL